MSRRRTADPPIDWYAADPDWGGGVHVSDGGDLVDETPKEDE